MARRRYLSTDAGRDKAIRDLAVKEPHAATFYLLSIPAAGDDATFPSMDPEELLGEIWPVMARFTPPEDVQRWVDLLTECGLWERCDGVYRLPAESFYRYQTYIRGARRGANAEPEDDPNPVRAPRSLEESRARLKNQLAAEPQRTTPQQSAQRRKSPQNATSFSLESSSSFSSLDSSSPDGEGASDKPTPPSKQEKNPACRLYRKLTGSTLNVARRGVIENAIPTDADADSLDRWGKAVTAWVGRGYRRENVTGMLEWWRDGPPPAKSHPTANGHAPRRSAVSVITDELRALQEKRNADTDASRSSILPSGAWEIGGQLPNSGGSGR